MTQLETKAAQISTKLLRYLILVHKSDTSIKFFTRDLITMMIWLFIMNAYADNKKVNIEDIARAIAEGTQISKPSLRLILENAKEKGFVKFTHNQNDTRSWIIEPETIAIEEFNKFTRIIDTLGIA